MRPSPPHANGDASPVDGDALLAALRGMLPSLDLDVMTRRVLQQKLADQFGVTFEQIHEHAGAIRQTIFAYCDDHLELGDSVYQEAPATGATSGDARDEVESESDDDSAESDDEDGDDEGNDSDYNPSYWHRQNQNESTDPDEDESELVDALTTVPEGEQEVKLTSFEKAYVLSERLAELVGAKVMSRSNLVCFIHRYVKKHKLRDVLDRKTINCDKQLRDILDCDTFTAMTLGSLLNKVIRHPNANKDVDILPLILDHDSKELAKKKARPNRTRLKKRRFSDEDVDGTTKRRKGKATKNKQVAGRVGIHKERRLSPALSVVCGAEIMSRQDCVRGIWDYVKLHDLKRSGRIWPDENLRKVFGEQESVSGKEIFKLLDTHLTEA